MGGARRILWTAALLLICHGSLSAQDRIAWVSSWPEAQALAVKHQRLVLVHFWQPSCIACQKLERTVFNQPEFIRAIHSNYVPMSVNLAENPDAGRHFGVQQTPTDIVLSLDGKELYRGACPTDIRRYMGVLDETAAAARVNMPALPRNPESTASFAPAQPGIPANAAPANVAPANVAPFNANPANANPANNAMANSEFPLPNAAPNAAAPSAPGRTPNPAYVTNQWVAPASGKPAPTIPEQRASYTSEYGGEFRPAVETPTAPPANPTANQFPLPNQSTSTLSPPAGATRTVEPPAYETASMMPYRGAANAGPPVAVDALPPQGRATGLANTSGPVAPQGPPASGQFQGLASASPPPAAGPRQDAPLALDGYCPVTLVESEKWVKGDKKFGAIHEGRTYLFASAEAQAKFLQDQGYQKYAPALSGYDPVKYAERGELVDGKRMHGVFFHNQVFLFADEAGLQQFWADPERYATIVRAEHERSAMRTNTQR